MALRDDQLPTLKTDIDANSGPGGEFENIPNTNDGDLEIAQAYNLVGTPDNWVLNTAVPYGDLKLGIDYGEYEAITQGERDSWVALTGDLLGAGGDLDATDRRVRDALIDIFPPTAPNTRAGLLDELSRLGLRGENLYATDAVGPGGGNGSSQQSAQELDHVGNITARDVQRARALP